MRLIPRVREKLITAHAFLNLAAFTLPKVGERRGPVTPPGSCVLSHIRVGTVTLW